MLLDDLQDVALAHGPQAADGTVPVAWLGQQAIAQAQQLLARVRCSCRRCIRRHCCCLGSAATPRCRSAASICWCAAGAIGDLSNGMADVTRPR